MRRDRSAREGQLDRVLNRIGRGTDEFYDFFNQRFSPYVVFTFTVLGLAEDVVGSGRLARRFGGVAARIVLFLSVRRREVDQGSGTQRKTGIFLSVRA